MALTATQKQYEDKYKAYAKDYIANQPAWRIQIIKEEIERAIQQNRPISLFVDTDNLREVEDKGQMATFHVIARDMGYKAGIWSINKHSVCASMVITR
jgi:hypothetical protein